METILVAYGELALKSSYVRGRLEDLLARQIRFILTRNGIGNVRVLRRFGRIYVEGAPAEAAEVVANTFGVVSAMPARRTSTDIESLIKLIVEVAMERIGPGQSFAVRPKTVGDHPYTSHELAVDAGSAILGALSEKGVHVDLDEPDMTLHVEARDRDAFVYTQVIQGIGGLPYGSQGRLVSLFSGGLDSPVAAWLMMKRGAATLPLFVDQRPYVGESYVVRVVKAFETVSRFAPTMDYRLSFAPFGEIMERIMRSEPPRLRCVLCKRCMYRVARDFAVERSAQGIVTGESLGQVASQTLANLYVIDSAVDMPVLRPLIGMDKVEIERIARRIGTYEISARSVEGCTVVPDKPATRAQMEQVTELEEDLGLHELCAEAAKKIVLRDSV